MPHRKHRGRARLIRALKLAAYTMFIGSGAMYVFFPPVSSAGFFGSAIPAIAWGAIFVVGGAIALIGTFQRVPHTERLGLTLVAIAGLILTLNQGALMLDAPVTLTRGGGTLAYGAFAAVAAILALMLEDKIEAINLVASIEEKRLDDGP